MTNLAEKRAPKGAIAEETLILDDDLTPRLRLIFQQDTRFTSIRLKYTNDPR